MTLCPRCEIVPEQLPESGALYLSPPERSTENQIVAKVRELGLEPTEMFDGIYRVVINRPQLEEFCAENYLGLNDLQLRDTRCLLVSEGGNPSIAELVQMRSLKQLVASVQGEFVRSLLAEKRILSYFHPILPCDEPEKPFAYECLLRGVDDEGAIVPAGKIFGRARDADLLFQLDRAARLSAITCGSRHGIKEPLFINFNPTSIYNPEYCLQTTVQAIREAGITPENIVFEVVESEHIDDTDHLLTILDFYRRNGFRVALDDLGAGYSSLNLLSKLQPDFIKLDMDLVRDVETDSYKGMICSNILSFSQDLGVPTIAEGVETAEQFRWLRDNGATFVQGFLFARPEEAPPTVQVPAEA